MSTPQLLSAWIFSDMWLHLLSCIGLTDCTLVFFLVVDLMSARFLIVIAVAGPGPLCYGGASVNVLVLLRCRFFRLLVLIWPRIWTRLFLLLMFRLLARFILLLVS